MTVHLNTKNFFENYIINTQSADLNKNDRRKALIYSIALGIFTVGLVHLAVAIKGRVFAKKTGEKQGDKNVSGVASGNLGTKRPQDDSLENISKMTEEEINTLCGNLQVKTRDDYKKAMLIHAIKAENFSDADMEFHNMIPHFQVENDENENVKQFVLDDIAAGRNNEENTLLHEILKCKFLSPKTKGSAFGFIIRDGHDYLRDYVGTRTVGEKNKWGNRPRDFPPVQWGNSLKEIFDTFSLEDKKEFFANSNGIADRLKSFTGIEAPQD